MTLPLTPRPDHPLEPTASAKTTSTQLFGVYYINLTGLVDSMVPNSGSWSSLGRSVSYIIKLAPILWWALSAGLAAPCPETPNASTYNWLPDTYESFKRGIPSGPETLFTLLQVGVHTLPTEFSCTKVLKGNSSHLDIVLQSPTEERRRTNYV
ncbi:hypothetical protein DSO57_1003599 [Entomophthora muscae]|uniref:Uncharacterized protein n=1 Tax=Entomophthora muscae TaxID=34485 RepID=A0ACC2TVT8_9FUNG|nr:hypothetical protein DSO57_1003599 [Entomophthora muscae]